MYEVEQPEETLTHIHQEFPHLPPEKMKHVLISMFKKKDLISKPNTKNSNICFCHSTEYRKIKRLSAENIF